MTPTSIGDVLKAAIASFPDQHDAPHLEAQVLMAHLLDCDRSALIAHAYDPLPQAQKSQFLALIKRRLAGEPVAYITGHREFWSLDLQVNHDVLIPRPETELLVETVITHLHNIHQDDITLGDLGTGSGAIALALASEFPKIHITATDTSPKALRIARENARRMHIHNLVFTASDWCEALRPSHYHVICANPPYIADSDPHLERGDLRYEPQDALRSGADGLLDLQQLIVQARRCLHHNGYLFLEHGCNQGPQVRNLFTHYGYRHIQSQPDLAGHERVCIACHSH